MLEILGKTSIDFMGKRRWAFLFSGIMVVLGLVALIQIGRGAANLGIDFSGGTAVQLKFDQPIRIDEHLQLPIALSPDGHVRHARNRH